MLLLLLIAIPLLGGLILFLMREQPSSSARMVSLLISLGTLAVAALAYLGYDAATAAGNEVNYAWINALNIRFHLGIDGLSLLLVGLTAFLTPLIILSTARFSYERPGALYALILLAEAALMGVFLAKDIFLFYFFFEAALVPVYFIAALWGGDNASRVTFKMFVYTIFGSLFMLVALIYLYSKGQTANIQELAAIAKGLPIQTQGILFWGFMVAFAIKMPILPFHTWQPDAYTVSPTPATMLLSGLLSKMGVYGMLRILLPLAPTGVAIYGNLVMAVAIGGLIYGSIIAIRQDNIKRLIAYSSFAHMGLMAAGVLSGTLSGLQGAIFQMLAHGINAVGLFFIVKIIADRTGTRSLAALGGITQRTPVLSILFMIILLGSVALPLTNGFIGEFLLLKGVYDHHRIMGIVAGLTIILGAVYMLRLMQRSMFGEQTTTTAHFEDVKGTEVLVLSLISAAVLLMGVFPNVLLKISEPVAQAILAYLN